MWQEPVDISDVLDRSASSLNDADGALKQLSATLSSASSKLNGTLAAATIAISNVNDVVVGVKQGRGTAGILLRDEAVAASIRRSIANAQQATSNFQHASDVADAMVSDLQSRNLPQKADNAMNRIQSAASNIDDGSKQLSQIITEVMKPDEEGLDAAANFREFLSNANSASEHLVDDAEAFKHNVLVRGSFAAAATIA